MGQLLTDIFNNSLCWKMTNLGSNQGNLQTSEKKKQGLLSASTMIT